MVKIFDKNTFRLIKCQFITFFYFFLIIFAKECQKSQVRFEVNLWSSFSGYGKSTTIFFFQFQGINQNQIARDS